MLFHSTGAPPTSATGVHCPSVLIGRPTRGAGAYSATGASVVAGTEAMVDGSASPVGAEVPGGTVGDGAVCPAAVAVVALLECWVVPDDVLPERAAPLHATSTTDAVAAATTRIDMSRRVTSIHPSRGGQDPPLQG